jgi:hypothetical protein
MTESDAHVAAQKEMVSWTNSPRPNSSSTHAGSSSPLNGRRWHGHEDALPLFQINICDDHGDSIERHVAGLDDFETAVAAYWSACRRWPTAKITLRREARIIEKSY